MMISDRRKTDDVDVVNYVADVLNDDDDADDDDDERVG